MPSFATEVKNELSRNAQGKPCCRNAELASLLRMGAVLNLGQGGSMGLSFLTENAAVARRVLQLLKDTGQVRPEVTVSRSKRLKKNNRYLLRVAPGASVRALLEELGMFATKDTVLLRRKCCRRAYLRGAFLGGGTVNRPGVKANLEFVTRSYDFANTIVHLLKNMDFPAGITDRRGSYQIYMKDGEEIMDLLSMLGAPKAVEELAVARNLREVRSQVNRIVNCETANLQRSVQAAVEQVAAIKRLRDSDLWEKLPVKSRSAGEARLANPEASLSELGEILGISRGAVHNRLKKLMSLGE